MRKVKRCLLDELALHKGKTVMIGARSSFFFIGPSEEAISDIETLGLMNKYCVTLYNHKKLPKSAALERGSEVGNRDVRDVFAPISAPRSESVVILVSGKEFGMFWTRDEYLSGRKALLEELDRLKSGQ